MTSSEAAHSALAPAGPQAAQLAELSWLLFGGAATIFVAVMAILATALWRARRGAVLGDLHGRRLVMLGGVAVPAVVLAGLVAGSVLLGRDVGGTPPADALPIEVTGWRWWWEVRYPGEGGAADVVTANEIHVPVGRPVRVTLRSRDVIHSFWLPNLQGKMDMIPGVTNTAWFTAGRVGAYRGLCAEFCGAQHARMQFVVVAEPPAVFAAWLAHQRRAPAPPRDAAARRGRAAFADACRKCHVVRGLAELAASRVTQDAVPAPDLTHLAGRRTLAAGTLPNTTGHLGGWIADPQAAKPGARMPAVPLTPDELQDLLVYLASLE